MHQPFSPQPFIGIFVILAFLACFAPLRVIALSTSTDTLIQNADSTENVDASADLPPAAKPSIAPYVMNNRLPVPIGVIAFAIAVVGLVIFLLYKYKVL